MSKKAEKADFVRVFGIIEDAVSSLRTFLTFQKFNAKNGKVGTFFQKFFCDAEVFSKMGSF